MSDPDLALVNLGRLARLKFQRNAAARKEALDTIRAIPNGLIGVRIGPLNYSQAWHARIGGRMRGKWHYFPSREAAERAVHAHYNDQMLAFVQREGKRPHGSE